VRTTTALLRGTEATRSANHIRIGIRGCKSCSINYKNHELQIKLNPFTQCANDLNGLLHLVTSKWGGRTCISVKLRKMIKVLA
jgi:hypothetical protein